MLEGLGINKWNVGLGRSMHLGRETVSYAHAEDSKDAIVGASVCINMQSYLGQNLLGKSLGDLVEIGFNANLLEAFLFCFGKLLDVAVHGILEDTVSNCGMV